SPRQSHGKITAAAILLAGLGAAGPPGERGACLRSAGTSSREFPSPRAANSVLTLPLLVGRVASEASRVGVVVRHVPRATATTPTPNPSPQGSAFLALEIKSLI